MGFEVGVVWILDNGLIMTLLYDHKQNMMNDVDVP